MLVGLVLLGGALTLLTSAGWAIARCIKDEKKGDE